jgi:hypothetical protein
MKNVEITVKGKSLIITVDLSKVGGATKDNPEGLSASGKTIIIGTTAGNARIAANGHGEVNVGLNVYKYPPKK